MSNAPKGLVLAAPKASASLSDVLAKASAEDKKVAFSALKAEMEPDPEDKKEDGEGDENCKDKAKDKAKDTDTGAAAEASADFKAGYAAANARFATVFASEHFAGREIKACDFLSTSMSGDEIVTLLAKEPKSDKTEQDGKVMMETITGQQNANLGTSNDNSQQPQSANNHGWNEIHAKVRDRRG